VSEHLLEELTTYLAQARDLEQLDLDLLAYGCEAAKDSEVREIYRSHRAQTESHLRLIDARLQARGYEEAGSTAGKGVVGAFEIKLAPELPRTPTRLAVSAYAFESLEIAVYHLVDHLADRCDDDKTVEAVERILEEEEQTAELLAGTFDRALAASL
jgi:ferritin-like metal-binding protein YciE